MHNDIQEVLGQNFGVPDDIDEEELLGELDALEADMAFDAEEQAAGSALPSYMQAPPPPPPPPSRTPHTLTSMCIWLCIWLCAVATSRAPGLPCLMLML